MAVVWLVRFENLELDDESHFFDWLTPEEKAKHGRFATKRLRDQYLLTRALSRWVLTREASQVSPRDWLFERTIDDRPRVRGPIPLPEAFDFNLSNTLGEQDGVVVAVVSHTGSIGIDIEPLSSAPRILDIASRIFTVTEREELALHPSADLRAVELWTLKEAYLKALGTGISEHLDELEIAGMAAHWRFDVLSIPGYAIAVTRSLTSDDALEIMQVSPADLRTKG